MENKTKEEILKEVCHDFDFKFFSFVYSDTVADILTAMDKYAEQSCEKIQELFLKPSQELKPLEELYRRENPRPDGKFYIPDATEFYKWIRIKILGK